MSNSFFRYCRLNHPAIPMKPIHVRVLRILSVYPRYIREIKSIAMSKAEHDMHNGILNPKLQELERWGLILRKNPNASRSSGYQYAITSEGLDALRQYDEAEVQMALAPSIFA